MNELRANPVDGVEKAGEAHTGSVRRRALGSNRTYS